MLNKAWYDKLTPAQKQIVDEASKKNIETDRKNLVEQDLKARDIIEKNKVKIYIVPDPERKRFKAAAEPAYKLMRDRFGAVLEDLQKAVQQASK